MLKALYAVAMLGVVILPTAANAQFMGHSTEITGDTTISVQTKNQVQTAAGVRITADQSVGTIYEDTKIEGDTTINVSLDNQVQTAAGVDIKVSQHAGSIGAPKAN